MHLSKHLHLSHFESLNLRDRPLQKLLLDFLFSIFCVLESSKYYPRLTFDGSTDVEKYTFLVERSHRQGKVVFARTLSKI